MPRAFRSRLSFRLGLGFFFATAAILIGAGVWNLRLQRAHLTRLVVTSASERADGIRRSTREAMMRNSPGELRRIIEDIAAQPSIDRIRLFDKQGRIQVSTDAGEIGTLVDTVAEQCISCHGRDEPLQRLEQRDRARIFERDQGGRVLGVIAPIRNEPSCADAACHAHSGSQTILGVLDVQLSLDSVDQSIAASERQMILGLLGTALGALVVAWLLTWRMVLRPVGRLTQAASRVAAGELSTSIPVDSPDEIGEMTEAWNAMIAKLGRAQIVLERWGRTLEQKVEEKTNELEQAHQRMLLVEKMASLGKLAAVVAHEVNNPLTGIGTYARLLRKRSEETARATDADSKPPDREMNRILKLIEEEAGRCGKIVRNLLLSSRTPAASFSDQEIKPLIDHCCALVKHQAERGEVELELDLAPDLPRISCDASQIQQMILALALNAIEATPAGGRVTISARPADAANGAVLEVADTGRGIPAEDLDRIFEPFFTTKEEGGGIGLGLAVVYGIVNRHNGTIEVESPSGTGTVVSVYLPRHQAPPTNPNSEAETPI